MAHAHSEGIGVPEEFLVAQHLKNSEEHWTYQCTIVNCGKRYKSLNGLKVASLHYLLDN